MNYVIDFIKLIVDLLPVKLRRGIHVDWLFSLLKGVRYLYDEFLSFRDASLLEISRNGQVIVLEDLLNTKFDPIGVGIYITDPTSNLEHTALFLVIENQLDQEAYLVSEIPPGTSVALYTVEEFDSDDDFIVWVPVTLVFNMNQLRACVNKYKIAPMRYSVLTY